MALKAILAREIGEDIVIRVHLDETKVKDGSPDPDWVTEYRFGKQPPAGQPQHAYRQACRREAKALARLELAQRTTASDPGTVLTFEGQDL